MNRLAGKIALITGAGTGIGRACALLFAKQGARLVLVARRAEPIAAVAEAVHNAGGEAFSVRCDVTQDADVQRAVGAAASRYGRLDILVNNAGGLFVGTAEQTPEDEWDRLMDVNAKGAFLMSRAAIPVMRRAGRSSIVNVGSILGIIGMKNRAAYSASKGAVSLLTKAMALDHAADGIRVNCICPAIVDTELVQGLFTSQPDPEAARRARMALIPLGRLGQPEDVANFALFLASDESSWITGATFPVDGGLSAY